MQGTPIANPPRPPTTARRPPGSVPPHLTKSVASSAFKDGPLPEFCGLSRSVKHALKLEGSLACLAASCFVHAGLHLDFSNLIVANAEQHARHVRDVDQKCAPDLLSACINRRCSGGSLRGEGLCGCATVQGSK